MKVFSSIRKIRKLAEQVDELAEKYKAMDDSELKGQTAILKERLTIGETLDDILPEAFATAREASTRTLGMTPYLEQVMGAIILHQGNLAEVKTGEGKTLMATMAVYLNALEGKGVHVITVNEYLAQRDAEWNKPLYEFLGLSVGVNLRVMSNAQKQEMYSRDVLYTTNAEAGFDYLRDNLAISTKDRVMRGLSTAFIDEADSVLIDEARTPLIISGGKKESANLYKSVDKFCKTLIAPTYKFDKVKHKEVAVTGDYEVDAKSKQVILREIGQSKAELFFKVANLYAPENAQLVHHIKQALKANFAMENGVEYIVQDDKVIIVDQFTGRVMLGRTFSDGLHQALEAKEGVTINEEVATTATITYQNFFRLYDKLAGMTGTAKTEEEEFISTYNMKVIQVPTHKPVIRVDAPDRIFGSKEAKYEAIVADVKKYHAKGQPILLGTPSVDVSELLSKRLKKEKIPHVVLNAKQNAEEADIIAKAGQKNAITIATNMAGRGTDIQLTDETRELGGLVVLGAEKHEARRIDNQLRGRSGRQGDAGYSQFYVSLEDDLMKRFGSEKLRKYIGDGEIEEVGMVNKSIEVAQKQIEGANFDARKNLLDYDDVLRRQREIIYAQRNRILESDDTHEMVHGIVDNIIDEAVQASRGNLGLDMNYLKDNIKAMGIPETLIPERTKGMPIRGFIKKLQKNVWEDYNNRLDEMATKQQFLDFEKEVVLRNLDHEWVEHIDKMTMLRQSINLRSYSQENPLQQYVQEGFWMFEDMNERIGMSIVNFLEKIQFKKEGKATAWFCNPIKP